MKLHVRRLVTTGLITALALTLKMAPALAAEPDQPAWMVRSRNPDPKKLPTLGVWKRNTELLVSATFPNLPDFTCDAWCYESPLDFLDAQAVEGGKLVL